MTNNYPFDNENYYLFDSNKVKVLLGLADLLLQQDDVDFTEDFADDTGFTYDSDKAEFIGGLIRQIDKRPANAVFYASYTNDEDASWGNGTLTGTLGGSASVHDGYLDATDGYEEFPVDNFASMTGNTGSIQFRISFDYTGAAPNVQYIIQTSPNTISRVYLAHNDVYLQCYIFDTTGTLIYNMTFGWTPNAGSIYNFAIDWNSTNSYFSINGQLQDSDTGTLNIGSPGLFRIGGGSNTAFQIYDIAVFDTLQHSSNYTPDWSGFYETAYLGSSVVLPEMEHTGDGSIKLFNSLTSTYAGSPRILLEIGRSGNKLYWNGSAWVTSDETYDQATDPVTFNTNSPALDVDGEKYGQFTIVFPDSNTLSSYDELTANMNVDIGYFMDNPKIRNATVVRVEGITSITATVNTTGSDEIRWTIEVDGAEKYWSGTVWSDSTGYTDTNTLTDINTNLSTLITQASDVRWVAYLHSEDGSTSPNIDLVVMEYDFAGDEKDTIEKCVVWWYMAEDKKIYIYLKNDAIKYKNNVMLHREDYNFTITADDTEYCEVELPDTVNMELDELNEEQTYVVIKDGERYEINVPNEGSKLLFDLLEAS